MSHTHIVIITHCFCKVLPVGQIIGLYINDSCHAKQYAAKTACTSDILEICEVFEPVQK